MFIKRVVVTGIGTINPLGNNVEEFFSNLDKGVSGARLIDRFDTTLFKTKFACEIQNYNPVNFGFDRKEERKIDKYAQFALIASEQALKDCNIDLSVADLRRIGVIVGSGVGGIETLYEEIMDYVEGEPPRFSPFLIPKIITNIAAGLISMKYGFRGPNYSITSACASSAHAICDACSLIQLGKADVMLTGGSEAPIAVPSIGGFNSSHAISTNNEEYQSASRPFDKTRDGFVMGEGAGVLILERLEHALNRGARIYGEIVGYGASGDGYHITSPAPEGEGAQRAMAEALADGGIEPSDIDYINAHGTSTEYNDLYETVAIKHVFGEHAYKLAVSSTKSLTGHLLGAAGAIEAAICLLALAEQVIPGTYNYEEADPNCDLDYVPNQSRPGNLKVALSNSFGFGGHNATLAFKRWEG